MVARPGHYHANFNGGELSPDVHGRIDIKQYYAGAAEMTNVEPVAQGGFRLLPRSRKISRIRRALEGVTPSNETDSSGNFDAPGTVYQIDFAEPELVSVVAVTGFLSGDLEEPFEGALQVQYNDGAGWQDLGAAIRLTAEERNVLRAAPPDEPVTATAVRVQLVETPAETIAITVGAVTARRELATYTPVRAMPFTFSLGQTYTLVMTVGHIDVWRDGAWIAATAIDDAIADPREIEPEQRFDTLMLFHEDMVSRRILRDGSDDEWPWDAVPWENIPQVDYGRGDYAHTVDEWMLYMRQSGLGSFQDVIVTVTVNGEESAGVTIDGADPSERAQSLATGLKPAIEALPSIEAGITVTVDGSASNSSFKLKIEFTGAGNEGSHLIAAQVVSHTEAAATVGHIVIGKKGGEDVISAARGWAACARFYQDRLLIGGFRSRRSAFAASVTAGYFDLNVDTVAASGALLLNLDTQGAERLQRMARSKHLVLFTSDAEYYISDRALASNSVPNIVECSRNGSAPLVPVVSNEGELLYVSRNRSVVYAARYSDISLSYDSEPMSLLASHLIDGIVDADLQRAESETDAARYYLVRDDGAMAAAILIRQQEIAGFVRWTTDGQVLSVTVDGANVPFVVVEREVGGAAVRFLEQLESGLVFDCMSEHTLDPAGTALEGLDDYEGATVWGVADGHGVGPFTVDNGAITLPFAASEVTIGRWTPLRARPLPIPRMVEDQVALQRPIRVHTVRLYVDETTSLAVGANDQPAEDVSLYRSGDLADVPLPPFTGPVAIEGLVGWTETGAVEITQLRPGWLQVRDFTVEAKI